MSHHFFTLNFLFDFESEFNTTLYIYIYVSHYGVYIYVPKIHIIHTMYNVYISIYIIIINITKIIYISSNIFLH